MKCNYIDVNNHIQKDSVVYADCLSEILLKQLFSHKICVLYIHKYAPKEVCSKIHNHLLQSQKVTKYTHEIVSKAGVQQLYYGVDRFGFPLNQTYDDIDGQKIQTYFTNALLTIKEIRKIGTPFLSPIDRLRLELDEHWPFGANLGQIDGKKVLSGIVRIMRPELSNLSEENPHCDSVPNQYFPSIKDQFAANIYLNTPSEGGELEIWDIPPLTNDEINALGVTTSWRSKLPKSIKIKPEIGDLMLFSTRRPHAITQFKSTIRTSLQTFIGINNNDALFTWN